MDNQERAQEFIKALQRQIQKKSLFADGVNVNQDPARLIISLAEEVGEVATDYSRKREYGAIAECIDVAHSAMLLAIMLDKDASVLSRIGF